MKSLINDDLADEFRKQVEHEINTCRVVDVPVHTSLLVRSSPFLVGCRVPHLTVRFSDSDPLALNQQDRQLFDCLSGLRAELRKLGVGKIQAEVELEGNDYISRDGRCDFLLHERSSWGRKPLAPAIGIAEIKVTDRIPAQPTAASLLQAASYAQMAAVSMKRRVWCVAVCVLGLKDRKIRCFLFESTDRLQKAAADVLSN